MKFPIFITLIVTVTSSLAEVRLLDPSRIRDVKTKVEAALRAGDVQFKVSSLAEGDDPAYGVIKSLSVAYRVDGRPASYVGKDPDTVDLLDRD